MKCPQCQTDNKDTAKFCSECGAKLELKCPQCGHSVAPSSKFCEECGHKLSAPAKPIVKEPSFDEKLANIQKYLPGGITEKILAQRGKIEGERKQVTVLFCDMENFTPLVEKLGHEEAFTLMDKVYEILIHRVHEFGGTVNDLSGDGMLALFGAPIALEDAPQRAIRSALAIHREMAQFGDRMKQEKGIPAIRMRAGIHTGPVVVGALGNDLRVKFTAIGDTVNLASRVQNLAEAGTTYVTGETFKFTEGLFRFESLGERKVKGREEPVRVYQVIAPSGRRTRFDVSAERGLTPFVGRGRELELLIDGLERARQGRGQAFSIIGEAGVGKSRLLYEFRKAVANENVNFFEGRCLSYGKGAAYHPIIDILKSSFGIHGGDDESKVREKVQNTLKLLNIDLASSLPFILELFSVKDSGVQKISMSPEGKKDRIIESLKQVVLRGSQVLPAILAIEDLHWADRSTEDTLKYLLESIPASKILAVFTYRPEFVHTWGGKSYHNQVTLNRLSNRETLAMAASLLGGGGLDQDVQDLILKKTEGVPFFIEEFIKSLKDLKIIRKDETKYSLAKDLQLKIPSTIHDVIMTRVDSLPPNAKELLQIGSVIEREFSYELIRVVTKLSDKELFAGFSVLKDSELLYERGIFPQSTYIFRHALTQEVVYDSLVGAKRKSFHEKVGAAIEKVNCHNLEVYYGVLAGHYMASENYEKAAEYSRLAVRKAANACDLKDAIRHAQNRVYCFEHMLSSPDRDLQVVDSRVALGLYQVNMSLMSEAEKSIIPIVNVAVKRDYRKRLGQIYTILGAYYYHIGTPEKATISLEDALRISMENHDTMTEAAASHWLALVLAHYFVDFERSDQLLTRAHDINLFVGIKWGVAGIKCSQTQNHFWHGQISKMFGRSGEAVKLAEESGDVFSKAWAWTAHGWSYYAKGKLKESEEYLIIGADLADRIELHYILWIAYFFLGLVAMEKREFVKGLTYFQKLKRLAEQGKTFASTMAWGEMFTNWAKAIIEGNIELPPLFECWEKGIAKYQEGWLARIIADIQLRLGDSYVSEAESWLKRAIAADQKNDTRFSLGHDFAFYSELHKRKGDLQKARDSLCNGIEILRECAADGWVEKYEKELASIS